MSVSIKVTYCAPPLFAEGGGVEPPTKFEKGGLDRTSTFRGGLLGKRGVTFFRGGGVQLSHKLKSEIFNDKKSLYAKIFFFVITKNSNGEILPKNFATFKR